MHNTECIKIYIPVHTRMTTEIILCLIQPRIHRMEIKLLLYMYCLYMFILSLHTNCTYRVIHFNAQSVHTSVQY